MDILGKIKLNQIETSTVFQNYLLTYEGKYFEINESLYFLLNCLVNKKYNLKETTKEYNLKYKKNHCELFIENFLKIEITNKLLKKTNSNQSSFKFKKTLISSQKLIPITDKFKILFSNNLLYLLNILSVIFITYFLFNNEFPVNYKLSEIFISSFIIFISVIFHEIGHATACRFYKIDHGDVGFALYLYFPVFYADVTNIWQLNRKSRLIVNYAGIYFQLIFLIPFFVFHFYSGNTLSTLIIYSILLSFLFDLNPFFKFDGYWFVSDLMGVPNLRERTNELLYYYSNRLFRPKERKTLPYFFSLKNNIKYWFFSYIILVNTFFVYIFFYKIPKHLFFQIKYFLNFKISYFKIENWQIIFSFMINILFMFLIFFFIYNSIVKFLKLIKQ